MDSFVKVDDYYVQYSVNKLKLGKKKKLIIFCATLKTFIGIF